MSGRIYDSGVNPICDNCANKMLSSSDRNFYGPLCLNCGGTSATYDLSHLSLSNNIIRKRKILSILKLNNVDIVKENLILKGIFIKF